MGSVESLRRRILAAGDTEEIRQLVASIDATVFSRDDLAALCEPPVEDNVGFAATLLDEPGNPGTPLISIEELSSAYLSLVRNRRGGMPKANGMQVWPLKYLAYNLTVDRQIAAFLHLSELASDDELCGVASLLVPEIENDLSGGSTLEDVAAKHPKMSLAIRRYREEP